MRGEQYYFSHDVDARNDSKILMMRSVYGMKGYGWYWVLIEMLRAEADYKIMLKQYTWNALAMQMQCTDKEVHEFVQFCIEEVELFASDGKAFWSNSLIRRMGAIEQKAVDKKARAQKAANARWGNKDKALSTVDSTQKEDNSVQNANAMHEQCTIINEHMHEDMLNTANEMKRNEIDKEDDVDDDACARTRENDDADFGEVVRSFSDNVHPVSGQLESDFLGELLDKYGKTWLLEAIKETALNHGSTVNYVQKVLDSWAKNGFKAKKNTQTEAGFVKGGTPNNATGLPKNRAMDSLRELMEDKAV